MEKKDMPRAVETESNTTPELVPVEHEIESRARFTSDDVQQPSEQKSSLEKFQGYKPANIPAHMPKIDETHGMLYGHRGIGIVFPNQISIEMMRSLGLVIDE